MKSLFNRFVREDQGQDLIEYALLAGFIALTSVGAITIVGTQLNVLWTAVSGQVTAAATAS
jgi:pilus assembly protein Flp/PilA